MCGRFALSKSDRIDWAQFGVRRGPQLPPHWNLGPGRPIAVVRHTGDGVDVAMLRWGLVPFWADDVSIGARMANARAESATEKPAFRAAFKQRRCLIPADGFYEWQAPEKGTRKQPWFIQRTDGAVFALAGLWERWVPKHSDKDETGEHEALETCTILTMEPNALVAPIHNRMPVIIDPRQYATWLAPSSTVDAARALMSAWDPADWTAHRVGLRINATAHDDVACAAPLVGDAFA